MKKKENKVIDPKNLPQKLPFFRILVLLLFIERMNPQPPTWVYYCFIIFTVIVFGLSFYKMAAQEKVDLLNQNEQHDDNA